MNALKFLCCLVMVSFFIGVLIPLMWLLWGFGPSVDMSSQRNVYEYPTTYVTTEKVVEKVVVGNETNCIKIKGENTTSYSCEIQSQ